MNKLILKKSVIILATILIISWLLLVPILFSLPIYSDEIDWKILSSRLFLDKEKLIYLFPQCSKGFLLNTPVSWYPALIIDSLIYQDFTNIYKLRYISLIIFVITILYLAWFVRKIGITRISFLHTVGLILAPFSLGTLPFLLVMNRPEQQIVTLIIISCTLPFIIKNKMNIFNSFLFTIIYLIIIFIILATHIKSSFFLPAILLSALFLLKNWKFLLFLIAGTAFAWWETFKVWRDRTDCPESSFLMQVFHDLSVRPSEIKLGIIKFIKTLILKDFKHTPEYWKSIYFGQQNQSWLKTSAGHLSQFSYIEIFINLIIPFIIYISIFFIMYTSYIEFKFIKEKKLPKIGVSIAFYLLTGIFFLSSIKFNFILIIPFIIYILILFVMYTPYMEFKVIKEKKLPKIGVSIAFCLLVGIFSLSSYQQTKNFYESGLIIPVIILAVIFAASSFKRWEVNFKKIIIFICCVAICNQFILLNSFQNQIKYWSTLRQNYLVEQNKIKNIILESKIETNNLSRVALQREAYSLLWHSSQPVFLWYTTGWWGTGIDTEKVIIERNVSYILGECNILKSQQNIADILSTDGNYCFYKIK